MYLTNLYLKAFRNISEQELDFGPSFNILVGDNAQGKTNILEAIYFLSQGRSFRTSEWRDLVEHGRARAQIEGKVKSSKGKDALSIFLDEPRRRFEKNGKTTRLGGFDDLHVVLFAPEEIMLLRTQPAARRKFIDRFIASFVGNHKKIIRDYETVIAQKNKLLTDDTLNEKEKLTRLSPWNDQMVSLGTKITISRKRWCKKINESLPKHHRAIAKQDGKAGFVYQPAVAEESFCEDAQMIAANFSELLKKKEREELIRRTSLVGPHKDDLIAHIGNETVKRFASQGQHRSFVLALKIAEAEIYAEILGERTILLLDDIASELDPGRNTRFFEYVQNSKGQVFITATRAADVLLKQNADTVKFTITSGTALRT